MNTFSKSLLKHNSSNIDKHFEHLELKNVVYIPNKIILLRFCLANDEEWWALRSRNFAQLVLVLLFHYASQLKNKLPKQ